jgi:hypothetical protein
VKAFILGLAGALVVSGSAFGMSDDGCLVCHRLKGLSVVDEKNEIKDCSISEALFAHSIHRNVGCTECHSKIEEYPHKPENAKVNCATQCHVVEPSTKKPFSHEKIFETWKESVHGKNYEKAPDIYPYCTYCHINKLLVNVKELEALKKGLNRCYICHQGKEWAKDRLSHVSSRLEIANEKNGFAVGYVKTRRDGWEVVELCSSCHNDKKKMEKAIEIEGIKNRFKKEKILHAVESYKVTMHAKMLYLDRSDTRAADCLDCHTNKNGNFHDIFRGNNPKSSINVKNIEKTCGRSSECHPLAEIKHMKNFATTKWVHMRPVPENIGQKVVLVVQYIFITLVTVVLTLATGLITLDLIKNLRSK